MIYHSKQESDMELQEVMDAFDEICLRLEKMGEWKALTKAIHLKKAIKEAFEAGVFYHAN